MWTPVELTVFVIEMSELQHQMPQGNVKLPGGQVVNFQDSFTPNRDRENEITDWSYTIQGKKYVVLND